MTRHDDGSELERDVLDAAVLDAIGERDLARLGELRRDPAAGVRCAELERWLASAGRELRSRSMESTFSEAQAAIDVEAPPGFLDQVLARTTRSDLSWRADLESLARFVADRMRASRPLRWVAASLLAHLVALPALAWYMQARSEQRELHFRVETPAREEQRFEESREEMTLGDDDGRGDGLAEADNHRRRSRFLLGQARRAGRPGAVRSSAEPATPAPRTAGGWLSARVEYLEWGTWDPELEAPPGPAREPARAFTLAGILRLELLLDRFVLENVAPASLALGLSDLELWLGRGEFADPAERALAQACLERATNYGLWESERSRVPSMADPLPLGPAWLELLGGALGGQALDEHARLRSLAAALRR